MKVHSDPPFNESHLAATHHSNDLLFEIICKIAASKDFNKLNKFKFKVRRTTEPQLLLDDSQIFLQPYKNLLLGPNFSAAIKVAKRICRSSLYGKGYSVLGDGS